MLLIVVVILSVFFLGGCMVGYRGGPLGPSGWGVGGLAGLALLIILIMIAFGAIPYGGSRSSFP